MAASPFYNELILHLIWPEWAAHTLPVVFGSGWLLGPVRSILLFPSYTESFFICSLLIAGEETIKPKGLKNDRHIRYLSPCFYMSCDQHEHIYTTFCLLSNTLHLWDLSMWPYMSGHFVKDGP